MNLRRSQSCAGSALKLRRAGANPGGSTLIFPSCLHPPSESSLVFKPGSRPCQRYPPLVLFQTAPPSCKTDSPTLIRPRPYFHATSRCVSGKQSPVIINLSPAKLPSLKLQAEKLVERQLPYLLTFILRSSDMLPTFPARYRTPSSRRDPVQGCARQAWLIYLDTGFDLPIFASPF